MSRPNLNPQTFEANVNAGLEAKAKAWTFEAKAIKLGVKAP